MYNRAPQPAATIAVSKRWRIDGTDYANGEQPDTFAASLSLTGPGAAGATPQGWDVVRTGYSVDDTATMSEQVTLPPLCTLTSSTVVRNGPPPAPP